MTIKRFEDLECWKDARELTRVVYALTRKENFRKDFGLMDQIRRSAVSSMANIAEGFHRSTTRDFMRFLDYTRASFAETISHGYVALDQKYISDSEMKNLKDQADMAWKKVNNLMKYLAKNKNIQSV